MSVLNEEVKLNKHRGLVPVCLALAGGWRPQHRGRIGGQDQVRWLERS